MRVLRMIWLFLAICLVALSVQDVFAKAGKDIYTHGSFDVFNDNSPAGWIVNSWNQDFLQEKYGKATPGRSGRGHCLEFKPGSGAAIIDVVGPVAVVSKSTDYVFKGYYASTCDRVDVECFWLDEHGEQIGSFLLKLPDTQDQWTEFFEEVKSPANAAKFRPQIQKKWQTGRVRFDDITVREGKLQDYAAEFSPPPAKKGELRYPIFGWCTPGCWADPVAYPLDLYNSDKAYAEYALANFTRGANAKFGVQGMAGVSADDQQVIGAGKDPDIAWFHGGDEPGKSAFPEIAKIQERVRRLAPEKPFWINLLPTYGFNSYSAYEDYLGSYIKTVKPDLFTYDFYALSGPDNGYSRDYFANLEIARKHALRNNIDWGIIVGVTAFAGVRSPSEAEMRWQTCTSLTYGSKMLGWFTYLTEIEYGGMNWRDAAINWDGSRSRHYTMLRRINAEVLKLGNILLRLQSTGVYHTRRLPELTQDIREARLIKGINGGEWVLGEFSGAGKDYFMLCNRDYLKDQKAMVTLSGSPEQVSVFNVKSGKWMLQGSYNPVSKAISVLMPKGDALLFRIDRKI